MKPEIYADIIEQAHKNNLRVAAHMYQEEDAQQLVDDGVNVLAHSVRDAEIPDSLVWTSSLRAPTVWSSA